MRIVGRGVLEAFKLQHADVRAQLNAWLAEAEKAEWKTPSDIKARYRNASLLSNNVVVFDIKGNKYRLVTIINYELKIVLVRRIGTHAEYSKWDL